MNATKHDRIFFAAWVAIALLAFKTLALASGETHNVIKFSKIFTSRAGAVIKPDGTMEIRGKDGEIIAVLYQDGKADFRESADKVVHTMADTLVSIATKGVATSWKDHIPKLAGGAK